jgi:aryl-alcohol dehydrogenase-like predicted oxidoreductase
MAMRLFIQSKFRIPMLPLTSFTFGCMSLGNSDGLDDIRAQIRVVRAAMDAGVSFHASREYAGGGAFVIMRHAFDEDRARVPKIILKIRCDHALLLKFDVEDALHRLNIGRIDVAQLCRAKHDRRPVVDDFLAKGEMWNICQELKNEGKVGAFVMEIFESFSPDAIRAVQAGLFPAYIFYFSPGERQASNALFDLLEQRQTPILSLRTLCGGILDPKRIAQIRERNPDDRAIARFEALRPIYEKSGAANWAEFSMSFLKSFPQLLTTIAGTSREPHLNELLEADRTSRPMAAPLADEIKALHRAWAQAA